MKKIIVDALIDEVLEDLEQNSHRKEYKTDWEM